MTEVQTLEGKEITQGQPQNPAIAFKDMLTAKKGSLQTVLPRHIPFEKFQAVVMTAVMNNPDLLRADRASLINSCIKAATDGLLPDSRDAALVIFNAKVKDQSGKEHWTQKVQYMPMYQGILKKVRQSGELAAINTQVVYSKDKFRHVLGDEDKIEHEVVNGNDRGEFEAVYCIAKLHDGTVMKEVMYKSDVERVRMTSKSGNKNGEPAGIWKDWYPEMAKKTVFRRLAKWLPQSIDKGGIVEAFANDDSMDVIDQETGGAATYEAVPEEGAVEETKTIESQPQPDLKKVIANKKDDPSAEVEKQETARETVRVIAKTTGEVYEMDKQEYDDMFPADRPELAQ